MNNKGWIKKTAFALVAGAALLAPALSGSVWTKAVQPQGVLLKTLPSLDVAPDWNFTCFDGSCPVVVDPAPSVVATAKFDVDSAQSSYGAIKKWKTYQYEEILKVADYRAVISSEQVFDDYYLPPHASARKDLDLWTGIYKSVDAVLRPNYRAYVTSSVNDLLASSVTYDFGSFARHLKPTYASNVWSVSTDFTQRVAATMTRAKALSAAGAFESVISDLFSDRAEITDLNSALKSGLDSLAAGLMAGTVSAYAAAKTSLDALFAFNSEARKLADEKSEQDEITDTIVALNKIQDRLSSSFASLSPQQVAVVQFFTATQWTGADYYSAMTDAALAAKYENGVNGGQGFALPANLGTGNVAATIGGFQIAMHQLDTVYLAQRYLPALSALSSPQSFVGPNYVAENLDSFVRALNVGRITSSKNPSFLELYNQLQSLQESGLFKQADLDNFLNSALANLLANRPVDESLQKLIKEALAGANPSDGLNAALEEARNEGLSAQAIARLLQELRNVVDTSGQVAKYVFIGLGSLVGAIAAGSAYVLARGFFAKRKYGAVLLEYARSRKVLTAVALAALALAVALIAIAVSGAF